MNNYELLVVRYLGVVFNLDARSIGHIDKKIAVITENFSVFGGYYMVVSCFIIVLFMSLQAPGSS